MSVPVHAYLRMGVHHITYRLGNRGAYRYDCLPALPPSTEGPRPYITSVTESGERGVHRSLYVKTPEPIRLHPLRLLAGEHDIVDVPIAVEDRVVVAPHDGGVYA